MYRQYIVVATHADERLLLDLPGWQEPGTISPITIV